tara:strand:- start:729 stop:1265 length:537 start_codon:yes stop_codon:yes gene_type:complete
MGYRSQVHLLFGMSSKSHLQQLVSVYRMLPAVQKHNLMEQWDYHVEEKCGDMSRNFDINYLHFYGNDWKWYDEYDEVQALQAILDLGKKFWSERKFPFAYRLVRTGEDSGDVEEYNDTTVTDEDTDTKGAEDAETMSEFFQELIYPYNNIEVNIKQYVSEYEAETDELITKLEEGETK